MVLFGVLWCSLAPWSCLSKNFNSKQILSLHPLHLIYDSSPQNEHSLYGQQILRKLFYVLAIFNFTPWRYEVACLIIIYRVNTISSDNDKNVIKSSKLWALNMQLKDIASNKYYDGEFFFCSAKHMCKLMSPRFGVKFMCRMWGFKFNHNRKLGHACHTSFMLLGLAHDFLIFFFFWALSE